MRRCRVDGFVRTKSDLESDSGGGEQLCRPMVGRVSSRAVRDRESILSDLVAASWSG